jgi:hypothetical protein
LRAAREISKAHEQLAEWPNTAVPAVGEFVVIVGGSASVAPAEPADPELIGILIGHLTNVGRVDRDQAISRVSRALNLSEADVRRAWKRARYARLEPDTPSA